MGAGLGGRGTGPNTAVTTDPTASEAQGTLTGTRAVSPRYGSATMPRRARRAAIPTAGSTFTTVYSGPFPKLALMSLEAKI